MRAFSRKRERDGERGDAVDQREPERSNALVLARREARHRVAERVARLRARRVGSPRAEGLASPRGFVPARRRSLRRPASDYSAPFEGELAEGFQKTRALG